MGAALRVFPFLPYATHDYTNGGYRAGGTVRVTNTFAFSGAPASLRWEVLLPAGWSFLAGSGSQGDVRPVLGATSLAEWTWTPAPAGPIDFSYTLAVPVGQTGSVQVVARAIVRATAGADTEVLARPDPRSIPVAVGHSADTNSDFRLSLLELTRVIELYNTRAGTTRTGQYRVQAGTEDGFAAGP